MKINELHLSKTCQTLSIKSRLDKMKRIIDEKPIPYAHGHEKKNDNEAQKDNIHTFRQLLNTLSLLG